VKDKIAKGKTGEDFAADYLVKKGYQILHKNYRHERGEIDLIAQQGKTLVFVEVKLRTSTAFGFPEEFVNSKKTAKVMETARHYLEEKNWHGAVRYDIIAIVKKAAMELRHFEDAFY